MGPNRLYIVFVSGFPGDEKKHFKAGIVYFKGLSWAFTSVRGSPHPKDRTFGKLVGELGN